MVSFADSECATRSIHGFLASEHTHLAIQQISRRKFPSKSLMNEGAASLFENADKNTLAFSEGTTVTENF